MEKLVHHLRESHSQATGIEKSQLTAMAHDPEIQTELKKIDEEFVFVEMNGLDTIDGH